MNFILGIIVILIINGSLITSSEYQYKGDRSIVHWFLGLITGGVITIITIFAIWY